MNQFKNYANRSVKFATRIPGFMNFHNVTDEIQLIKSSIHSLIILCLHRLNNSLLWNYFNVLDQKQLEEFSPFIEHIRSDVEQIQRCIYSLKLDEKEFSLLFSYYINK
jgi:phage-related protein